MSRLLDWMDERDFLGLSFTMWAWLLVGGAILVTVAVIIGG